jgi:short-subunit dehydrogenase
MGVQTGEARFSAYVASKAALDAFSRAASGEIFGDGVSITTVYMPLVRTAMSRPTQLYDLMPELTSAQAAEWICRAIVDRPRRVALPGALISEAAYVLAPRLMDAWMNGLYRASQPDASAASLRKAAFGVVRELARRLPGPFRRRPPPSPEPSVRGAKAPTP